MQKLRARILPEVFNHVIFPTWLQGLFCKKFLRNVIDGEVCQRKIKHTNSIPFWHDFVKIQNKFVKRIITVLFYSKKLFHLRLAKTKQPNQIQNTEEKRNKFWWFSQNNDELTMQRRPQTACSFCERWRWRGGLASACWADQPWTPCRVHQLPPRVHPPCRVHLLLSREHPPCRVHLLVCREHPPCRV
jgi:hypothetical protein